MDRRIVCVLAFAVSFVFLQSPAFAQSREFEKKVYNYNEWTKGKFAEAVTVVRAHAVVDRVLHDEERRDRRGRGHDPDRGAHEGRQTHRAHGDEQRCPRTHHELEENRAAELVRSQDPGEPVVEGEGWQEPVVEHLATSRLGDQW